MTIVYIWGGAGMAFVALEMVVPGNNLYWLGIGCLAAAVSAALHSGATGQIVSLLLVTSVSVVLSQRYLRHLFQKGYAGDISADSPDAVVGQQATVVEGIDNVADRGAVQIGERIWEARSLGGDLIPPESVVIIRRVTGARLFVEVP